MKNEEEGTEKSHDDAFVDDADPESSEEVPTTHTHPVNTIKSPEKTVDDDDESDSRCNLIINYIPSSITEERLKTLFAPFGTIESCKLMIDKSTRMSLGYGFVKYTDIAASKRAIDSMNGKTLENKNLKVAYARPAAGTTQTNLYVANLDSKVTKEMLDQIFAPYGQVIDSKILYDPQTRVSRGVAFVRYESNAEAEAAINALNGALLPNMASSLLVKYADTQDKKKKQKLPVQQPYGSYRNPQMPNNRFSPMGGYRPRPSTSVYTPFQPIYDPSTVYQVKAPYAPATAVDPLQYCLFVYHLPPEADENLLYRLFGPFGAIVSVKIIRDTASGQCKGYGFVNFSKLEDSQQAIVSMNGYQIGNRVLQVSYKSDGKKH